MMNLSFFSLSQQLRLARSFITRNAPLYVQFYITARRGLPCDQCNIIYSNADAPEATID